MKDSGISWVGEIPKEWQTLKSKFIFKQRNTRGNNICIRLLSPTQKYGVIPQDNYEELTGMNAVKLNNNTNYALLKTIHKGDYCISLRSFQGGFEYSEYEGVVSPAYQVFYPIITIADGYYKYLFKEGGFIDIMNSYTMSLRDGKNIAFDDFGDTFIPVPLLAEQQGIAEFLDRACGKIDGLKADIQAQIDTLEQYKRSVITEAVTHGLNPSAPMKDSGIPWVDEVPQNWGIRRVKYIATCLKKGNGITKEDIVEDGDTLCIRYGEIYTKYNLSFFECTTRTNKERISSKQYFTQGDILFAGTGELIEEIGKNIVYLGTGDCLAGGDIIILKHKQNARYLNYALNSECVQAQKSCNKAKLKVVHISAFEIGNIKIALPPLDEQQEIADYLDNKCAEIEQIIADKKTQIETLDGYKKSLIYEYVTGKKEAV